MKNLSEINYDKKLNWKDIISSANWNQSIMSMFSVEKKIK